MKIDSWYLSVGSPRASQTQFNPPEAGTPRMYGRVYGKQGFEDGSRVVLSPIVKVDRGFVHTESGSIYEVGEPDPTYAQIYPQAKKRLFDTFNRVGA